jgi:hypothetical protein
VFPRELTTAGILNQVSSREKPVVHGPTDDGTYGPWSTATALVTALPANVLTALPTRKASARRPFATTRRF